MINGKISDTMIHSILSSAHLISIYFVFLNTATAEYAYVGDTGPDFWPNLFPEECGEAIQSPIALHRHTSIPIKLKPFDFTYYNAQPISATLLNNGHTAQVSLNLTAEAVVSGGGLLGNYEFQQFHFHWGDHDRRGSEHVIDGIHYPLEMHIVHMNQKYGTTSEAIHHQDGLAVFGIFFKVGKFRNPILDSILQNFPNIKEEGSQVTFSLQFTLVDFLPFDTTNYYRYNGSLTTPTCNAAVIWTVFTEPLLVSEPQLNQFRGLLSNNKLKLVNNFRPIQPINNRIVYRNGVSPEIQKYKQKLHSIAFPKN